MCAEGVKSIAKELQERETKVLGKNPNARKICSARNSRNVKTSPVVKKKQLSETLTSLGIVGANPFDTIVVLWSEGF